MPDATRTFNGLTGAEIRTRLLQELEARLRDDTRLGAHLVFPVVTWTWRLELEASPPAGAGGAGGGGGRGGGGRPYTPVWGGARSRSRAWLVQPHQPGASRRHPSRQRWK